MTYLMHRIRITNPYFINLEREIVNIFMLLSLLMIWPVMVCRNMPIPLKTEVGVWLILPIYCLKRMISLTELRLVTKARV